MAAGPTRWNPEQQISGVNGLNYSTMAVAPNGNVMYAWEEWDPVAGQKVIKATVLNFEGEVVRAPVTVSYAGLGNTASGQVMPSVAVQADGDFVVSWQMRVNGSSNQDIYAYRFTSEGQLIGDDLSFGPKCISTSTSTDQNAILVGNPKLGGANDVAFSAFWENRGSIVFRHYKDGFEGTAPEESVLFQLGARTDENNVFYREYGSSPEAIYLSSGYPAVAFVMESVVEFPGRDPVHDFTVELRIFTNQGTWLTIGGVALGEFRPRSIDLIQDPSNGRILLTWTEDPFGLSPGIRGQYYEANGTKVGNEIRISSTGSDHVVSHLPTGFTVVAWVDTVNGKTVVKAKLYQGSTPFGSEFVVGTAVTQPHQQINPQIISHNDGRFTVTWTNAWDGNGGPIRGQTFDTRPSTGWAWGGSQKDDRYVGTIGSDSLFGAGGNDILSGYEGNDILRGEGNNDTLKGGNGDDTLEGGVGADDLRGGAGNDFVSYADEVLGGVKVNLENYNDNGDNAAGDIYQDIEGVIGSNFADTIVGSSGANTLRGGGGNDSLFGGGSADTLEGGAQDDTLDGGTGADLRI